MAQFVELGREVLSKCGVPEDNAKYNYDEWFEVWRHELDKVNDPRWLPPDPARHASGC